MRRFPWLTRWIRAILNGWAELGTDTEGVLEQFCEFLEALTSPEDDVMEIREITVTGGQR